ncbi:uncharacterized protein LOC126591193 [Malus sylvestris]|uniref:uncharacterized protein LOC126591193 n=1 Tax=Malus sylvestris TaxID=3752 RepID=UPI0021AD250E|nr:uncharacterized protein LOC126591193 [Malus sylvestris]XP_050112745.1 uncharacterized protein LOC126591193 [Malus sylvestris]XP_050112746.1 uncharacterized protein LOC126591193 [Malus sylvestris]XP_050112747.1 uncharacterized protein LOC126591193 [Malus sylvestris]XP_050112748.1 uncharacterized protein LOC126591193 [Malus sylvestris]
MERGQPAAPSSLEIKVVSPRRSDNVVHPAGQPPETTTPRRSFSDYSPLKRWVSLLVPSIVVATIVVFMVTMFVIRERLPQELRHLHWSVPRPPLLSALQGKPLVDCGELPEWPQTRFISNWFPISHVWFWWEFAFSSFYSIWYFCWCFQSSYQIGQCM